MQYSRSVLRAAKNSFIMVPTGYMPERVTGYDSSFPLQNAGKIRSRDQIIAAVWPEHDDHCDISDTTIDHFVHNLREKMESNPSQLARIISKMTFGYMNV